MYGPCLSPIGGGQALTSPKRHCLGELLPHQQADIPQAVPKALKLYSCETIENYLRFRVAMLDFGVHSYVLLPRLPLTRNLFHRIACIATYFSTSKA